MTVSKLRILFFLFVYLLSWSACDDGGNGADPCSNNFDQEAMFQNLANNLIIPRYNELAGYAAALEISTAEFISQPSQVTLDQLRGDWRLAYLSWQQAAPFEFGPAGEQMLRSSVNNFPVNVAEIDANVQSGDYDFDAPDKFDKGFPALDYLLYGIGQTDAEIIGQFSTGPLAANYQQYLTEVVIDIKNRVEKTLEGWTTDAYRDIFVTNTGMAAGTSLSLIVNNLNEHYEGIKRDKLGIPGGFVTLGFTNPDKVEAFYSGLSLELAIEAVTASRNFYLGIGHDGTDRSGLDDFLQEIEATKANQSLDKLIKDQYTTALNQLGAISSPLSAAVDQQKEVVENAYTELVRQILFLKTDMPSVLCVSITYVDNPSDSD